MIPISRFWPRNIALTKLSSTSILKLLLLFVILTGILFRTWHLFFAPLDLPYHFGGLYAEFSQQIFESGYRLPESIPFYSEGGIPFAYPPLPFYVTAFLTGTLALPEVEVINVLPPFVGALSTLTFYWLARALGFARRAAIGALTFFALLPAAYDEVLFGDGLSEAFGLLAIGGFAAALAWLERRKTALSAASAGILGGLCVLASPGSAYGAAFTVILFSLHALSCTEPKGRIRLVVLLGIAALTMIAVTAPYFVAVATNHSLGIFATTVGDHYADSPLSILRSFKNTLLRFSASEGGDFARFWDAILLASAVYALLERRDWLLPAWMVALLLIPREGTWLASVPGSLMAGQFMAHEVLPRIKHALDSILFNSRNHLLRFAVFCLLTYLGFHIVYLLYAHPGWAYVLPRRVSPVQITEETVEALAWGEKNLPADARIVVLYNGNVEDWTPHYVRRTVVNMVYGTEWEPEERRQAQKLNEALKECDSLQCVAESITVAEMSYSTVYLFLSQEYYDQLALTAEARPSTVETIFSNQDAAFVRFRPADCLSPDEDSGAGP